MKRTIALLTLAVLLLSGCGGSELSQRVIVNVLAVDYGDGAFRLTAGWLSGAQENEQTEFKTGFLEGRGRTPQQAFEALKNDAQALLFFGHNSTVVLGEGTVQAVLDETLRFLVALKDVRANAALFACAGEAGTFIRTETNERSFGDAVEALLSYGAETADVRTELYALADGAYTGGARGWLPVLEAVWAAGDEAQANRLVCNSLRLIGGGEPVATLRGARMQGLLLLENRVRQLSVETNGGAVRLIRPRTRFEIEIQEGEPRLAVCCAASAAAGGVQAAAPAEIDRKVRALLSDAYTLCVIKNGPDCFGQYALLANRCDAAALDAYARGEKELPAEVRCEINLR